MKQSERIEVRRRPTADPTVSVLVPTLNEARNLEYVLPRLPSLVDEVVVIDGGSTDGTVDVARALLPDVRIVREPRPGKGRALRTGFHASHGDIIVTIDADGSTDPREIPRFVDLLRTEADFVKGSRFLHGGGTSDMGWLRRTGNWCLTRTVRATFGGQYTDLCYGFNAFWRDILPFIDDARIDGFEIETHMNVRVLRAPLVVREVPSFEHARIHGSSNLRTFADGFRVLRTIIGERRRAGSPPDVSPVLLRHRFPSPIDRTHAADDSPSSTAWAGVGARPWS